MPCQTSHLKTEKTEAQRHQVIVYDLTKNTWMLGKPAHPGTWPGFQRQCPAEGNCGKPGIRLCSALTGPARLSNCQMYQLVARMPFPVG